MKPYLKRGLLVLILLGLAGNASPASRGVRVPKKNKIWQLELFKSQWPKRYDHRLRTSANVIFLPQSLEWASTKNQTIPAPHIDYRWSWINWDKTTSQPQLGMSMEAGNYAIVINYLKAGPEIRVNRNVWFSGELGAVAASVETPIVKPFYSVQLGLISPPISRIRLELEIGAYTLFDRNDRLLRLQLGVSSL